MSVCRAFAAATLLALAGCAAGPDYKRPAADIPPAYKELPPAGAADAIFRPAEPRDERGRGKWWEVFGDPALNELEGRIEVSNQTLAQAEAQFRNALAASRVLRADLFPTAGAGASLGRSSASTGRPGVPAGTDRSTASDAILSGSASWEADLWGRVRRNVEAGVASAQASAADVESARLSLHAALALAYFQLRGLDAERRLLDSNVAAEEKALQLTTSRYKQGIVSGVDVAQAETLLQTTRAQSTDVRIIRAQVEHAIAILVGVPPAAFGLPEAVTEPVPPAVPVALPSELLERRPDVAAAERRMAAANAQVGVASAAFFPRLVLSASGGWESATLASWISAPSLFWSVGAALAQTLFDAGRRSAQKEQALAQYDASIAAYRQDVLVALADVEDNLVALRLLALEERQAEAAVTAARQQLRLAQNRYEGGITTYLEVVTAQASALAIQRAAVDVRTRRMNASVNLIRALGGSWHVSELPSARAASSVFPQRSER